MLCNYICIHLHADTLTGWEKVSIRWHSKACVTMVWSMLVLLYVTSVDHTWHSLSTLSTFIRTRRRFCPEETTTSKTSCAVLYSCGKGCWHLRMYLCCLWLHLQPCVALVSKGVWPLLQVYGCSHLWSCSFFTGPKMRCQVNRSQIRVKWSMLSTCEVFGHTSLMSSVLS